MSEEGLDRKIDGDSRGVAEFSRNERRRWEINEDGEETDLAETIEEEGREDAVEDVLTESRLESPRVAVTKGITFLEESSPSSF